MAAEMLDGYLLFNPVIKQRTETLRGSYLVYLERGYMEVDSDEVHYRIMRKGSMYPRCGPTS